MSRRAVAVLVATACLVAAVGLVLVWGSVDGPDAGRGPSPTPTGTPSPTPAEPPVLAAATPAIPADPAAPTVEEVLRPLLTDPRLGAAVGVSVLDLDGDVPAYEAEAARALTPASTLKVLTAAAALEAVGPQTRFSTRALLAPDGATVFLVGGGDPMLTADPGAGGVPQPTRIADLAAATSAALVGSGAGPVRVVVDDRFFTGPAVDPDWEPGYLAAGVVSPVSALAVDGGRVAPGAVARSSDPALAAGEAFAGALSSAGVVVEGPVTREAAPRGSRELATVRSVPLESVVEHVLATSDNDAAEVLGRHTAFVTGRPADEAGATDSIEAVLAGLGLDTTGVDLRDASGLARGSAVPARLLAETLALTADEDRPRLRAAVAGLPVAGFTGTLDERFVADDAGAPGAGRVRAKTGTLTGVSSLAGVVTGPTGTTYAFVVLAGAVPPGGTVAARDAIDAVASALAACGCAPPTG